MSDDSCMSEALYVGLCGYIGTPTEVTVRREVMDIKELTIKPASIYHGRRMMKCGSLREGFRFEFSDRDNMYWFIYHKVITDLSQSSVYHLSKHSIILMEDTDTPPGFVRLRALKLPMEEENIVSSIIPFNGGMYISNSKWRQIMMNWISGKRLHHNIVQHGPCTKGVADSTEIDFVLCFHCSYLPGSTFHWRKRCLLHKWPPKHVYDDILRNGCHFVPIGNAVDENDFDWRLSFSHPEQKLVYAMNHTQFLCYGLLKIFLIEVVNRDIEEPFLCSYFVKTTMFWSIQIGHITWSPNNLLDCFWKCFKYILNCVHRGVMPNFFIPGNNMFASKLSTAKGARTSDCLLEQLYGYYEMGVSCLLESSTVRTMLVFHQVICNNLFRIDPRLGHFKCLADIDHTIKTEILYEATVSKTDLKTYMIFLRSILNLLDSSVTEYQRLTLQKDLAEVLIPIAFTTCNILKGSNKVLYRLDRLNISFLKLAFRFSTVSDMLHLAMYYYRTHRFRKSLKITALVKSKLAQPYLMYNTVNRKKYNECLCDLSLSRRMNTSWAQDVYLHSDVYYIQELFLEQRVSDENNRILMFISPFVLVDMLNVLCNYRLGNWSQCLQSLTDLQTLLLYFDGSYVPLRFRDLSWQILGICQHVVGDLHGALLSYQQSLRQEPYHKIQNATKYRIALALTQLA